MSTMNVSLPEPLRDFVERQVAEGGFGSSSEYVRSLLRREQDRLALRTLMRDGAASPRSGEADDAYFDALRRRIDEAPPSKPSAT